MFNAQGDVLKICRGSTKNRLSEASSDSSILSAIQIRRFEAKEAVEKERVTFSLTDLHPSVEVVGFIASYATDEISRRPSLNEFTVSCQTSIDSDDSEMVASSWKATDTDRTTLSMYTHDEELIRLSNYVVLWKFYRNVDDRSEWIFHEIRASGMVRSSVNSILAEAMQVFLLDIIPEIEIANRNALNTVSSICAALSRDEVLGIEGYFGNEGVARDEFAKLLLLALLKARPELRKLSRATSLVALMFEMFEQIDINGDGAVDWEEFTSFCVSLGLIATKDLQIGGSAAYGCKYRQLHVGPSTRAFPYQIRRIRSFPTLRLTAVIENKSSVILMYDAEMVYLHEFNHVARMCQEDNEPVVILDVDYVSNFNWLVVSSSDHSLTFWSVVNPETGAYVFAFKLGSRCPIPRIHWCGSALHRLVTISSEGFQLWDIEAKRVAAKLTHHSDRITSCIEISGETPLLATSSFDTKIMFLHVPTLTVAFELSGHLQGVLQLDYFKLGGLLLSSGFEHQAYCWSVPSQSMLTALGGHQASLIGAKFVSHPANGTIAMAVTGDERGHFRLWDLSRCLKGHSTNLATALQSFEIVTPNLCRYSAFACGMTAALSPFDKKKGDDSQELVDIVTGSFRLFRFHAVTHVDESAPPRHVVFNSVSNCFIGSVDGVLTVWSAHSGDKIEEPIAIRDADVCGIAFDLPRQRKLFVATSDGAVRLYNPITAMMLTKTVIHDGRISSLIYCSRSSCLITTGYDRRLGVSYSCAGKTDVEILRTVDNAHDSCITAAAYSHDLELVATGDDTGGIHLYDFQRLYLQLRCIGHTDEIRALQFHYSAALLFSADAAGVVYVWHVAAVGEEYHTRPVMELKLNPEGIITHPPHLRPSTNHSNRPSTGTAPPVKATPAPVLSILTIPETKHSPAYVYLGTTNGLVWGWDFRVLVNHARKLGVGSCFDYLFSDSRPWRRDGMVPYNAMLRVKHKASVLKVRTTDVSSAAKLPFASIGKPKTGKPWVVPASCDATSIWQAHAGPVGQLLPLPHPAQVFSVSSDGSIKVWDSSNDCLGTISTLSAGRGVAAPTKVPGASSTWKFSHHHHTANNARDQQVRIAREMLRRVQRSEDRQQRRRRESGSDYDLSLTVNTDTAEDPEVVAPPPPERYELPRNLAAADKLLAAHAPFSKESLRSGFHDGLFGVEEVSMLRHLADSTHGAPRNDREKPPLLATLMMGSPARDKKHTSKVPQGNEHELPIMRTLQHFPSEVERRRTTERRQPMMEVDIALSPFLREKLAAPDSPIKSTPKKRLVPSAVSIKMNATVTITDDVLLPAIQQRSSAVRFESVKPEVQSTTANSPVSRSRLSSYASAPCLPVHQSHETPIPVTAEGSGSTETASGLARSNIERKMRIYETVDRRQQLAVDGSDIAEENQLTSSTRTKPTLAGRRQQSQPQLSTDSRSKTTSQKRSSHSSVLPAASPATPSGSNPFAPHYTSKQVVEFGGILARFDNDSSGDIDKSEWVRMLQNCRRIFGSSDVEAAERLFHSIDRDDSGKISLKEILPMMFSKATPEQLHKMRQLIQAHVEAAAAAASAARKTQDAL